MHFRAIYRSTMSNADYPVRIFHCQNPHCGKQFQGRFRPSRKYCPDCASGNAGGLARKLAAESRPLEIATRPPVMLHEDPPENPSEHFEADKKVGELDWRKVTTWIEEGQSIRQQASWGQEKAEIWLGDGTHPVALGTLADLHIGAWGADHVKLRELTDQILNIPWFWVMMLGDEMEWAIKMRSAAEVTNQILPPKLQLRFFRSWFSEIKNKVACASWDNHEGERSEKAVGLSLKEEIVSQETVFFNGIGHLDVHVGEQTYKIAVSHKFPGYSYLNPGHAPMRYLRMAGTDREMAAMGDIHQPFLNKYVDGEAERVVLVAGSTHTNSAYAKRYFSLVTHPRYPLVELRHDRHEVNPFWSVQRWLQAIKGEKCSTSQTETTPS